MRSVWLVLAAGLAGCAADPAAQVGVPYGPGAGMGVGPVYAAPGSGYASPQYDGPGYGAVGYAGPGYAPYAGPAVLVPQPGIGFGVGGFDRGRLLRERFERERAQHDWAQRDWAQRDWAQRNAAARERGEWARVRQQQTEEQRARQERFGQERRDLRPFAGPAVRPAAEARPNRPDAPGRDRRTDPRLPPDWH